MTDEQIIKSMKLCHQRECNECSRRNNEIPYEDTCRLDIIRIATDLIERQKAEIEKLKHELSDWKALAHSAASCVSRAEHESIIEFAEMLKGRIIYFPSKFPDGSAHRQNEIIDYIDNLVEEMTEGELNA